MRKQRKAEKHPPVCGKPVERDGKLGRKRTELKEAKNVRIRTSRTDRNYLRRSFGESVMLDVIAFSMLSAVIVPIIVLGVSDAMQHPWGK